MDVYENIRRKFKQKDEEIVKLKKELEDIKENYKIQLEYDEYLEKQNEKLRFRLLTKEAEYYSLKKANKMLGDYNKAWEDALGILEDE